ncbi:hypothetical protein [Streptomonospora litoralis]|uniref:Uncharacterized protein n=1 Tax=Streptomonospora litoralis TaxID=2498135 RepID=A0A4V0ZJV2_9ACTN|nr:hypothetical protein [Streptomonospora litoralis]QBI54772.1 hypothetical protein EKD16_14970 [Streptomonospora litoralis]
MNPYHPGYAPFPAPPGHADRARLPGIAGLCCAIALFIAFAVTSSLAVQVGAVLVFGVPALVLCAVSFRCPGNRVWAGLAFVVMMAAPVVSALVEYAAAVAAIE